ncbi:hypothetical protein GFS60_06949 (plasmid) [Rhodococcus sp. WAY2]|nr:hypothetical protein GFS60_06949 [Rhodococcus sp. WAY2]
MLMTRAEIYGPPGPSRVKRLRGGVTSEDLVNRKFHTWPRTSGGSPTSPSTRPARARLCAAVLDAYSRHIVGWSTDIRRDSAL